MAMTMVAAVASNDAINKCATHVERDANNEMGFVFTSINEILRHALSDVRDASTL